MSHALHCWDIIQDGFFRRQDLDKDLLALNQLSLQFQWQELTRPAAPALMWENNVIVVTDAKLRILYASENMQQMNGYKPEEVKGKRPTMFQGKDTEETERQKISQAIGQRRAFQARITNYRKDGTSYVCVIDAYPIKNQLGELVNYIAFEKAA
jgi:PAS domain S-box-containing protein